MYKMPAIMKWRKIYNRLSSRHSPSIWFLRLADYVERVVCRWLRHVPPLVGLDGYVGSIVYACWTAQYTDPAGHDCLGIRGAPEEPV